MDQSKGTFYDHNVQKNKVGISSMKIFDGEDLSKIYPLIFTHNTSLW